ncbi:MAG: MarR family transcriptional regulator [Coriobacteriales bacterium]|nr:MarR family transcriptional regulator [Coriobacteriales bacterium]
MGASTGRRASARPIPSAEVGELASALHHTWHALVRGVRCPGLEGMQRQGIWVLSALLRSGPARMSDLGVTTEIASASLTGVVDRLEERGLVSRVRSAEDRRVVTVQLTEEGRAEVAGVHHEFARRLGEMLEPLSADERTELVRLMTKLSAHGPTLGDSPRTCRKES